MPCPYSFEIIFVQLSPRGTLRDVVLYRIKRRRCVQKPLRPEMRFKFRHQRTALGFARALDRHASFFVRRRGRRRTKFRARQSA
jgi:hypothetical protein